MPESDWPPNPKWFRTPHWNTECRCRRFFPAGLEPPPFWYWSPRPQYSIYWDFLESGRYLIPLPADEPDCGWYWEHISFFEQSHRRLELKVLESQAFPGMIEFRLTVKSIVIPISAEYENRAASPVSLLIGPEPRPTEFSWDPFFWADVPGDSGIDPPIGIPTLQPVPCLPSWSWGDPVPLWDYD